MEQRPSRDCSTVAQLILAIVGMLVYGAGAAVFISSGFSSGSERLSLAENIPSLALGLVALSCIALLVPSLLTAIKRLQNNPSALSLPGRHVFLLSGLGMVVWAGLLFVSESVISNPVTHFILPVIQVLAAALPIWWLYELGRRGLSAGSRQRTWGLFSFGLTVAPVVILLLEGIVMLLVGLVMLLILNTSTNLSPLMQDLSRMITSGNIDIEHYAEFFTNLAQTPQVLLSILVISSIFVPLVEELLKPLAMLVVANRRLTPSQGFVSGLICGAAFAFLETSGTVAGAIDTGWSVVALLRLGTGLLHITASGLVGWGLALAIEKKKSWLFLRNYLLASAMHGVWNAFGILVGYLPYIGPEFQVNLPAASWLATIAPYVLAVFSVGLFVLLVSTNWRLQCESKPPAIPMDLGMPPGM